MTEYFRIGSIVRAHGVHGAVKLIPETDDNNRFKDLKEAFIEKKDGSYVPVLVTDTHLLNNAVTVKIDGVNSVDQAEELRGCFICVDRAHAVSLKEGTYFICDLIGCQVSDSKGRYYGEITDVYQGVAQDVYEINYGKLSVPALKKLIISVDIPNKKIIFDADVLTEVGLFED